MAEVPNDNTNKAKSSVDEISIERQAADKARDLMGKECQTQPGNKQLMVLEAGHMDTGCSYKDFDKASGNNIDVLALYKEMRPSTVHFELQRDGTNLGGGTGVMVKKEADSCKIMTDNHVVSDHTKTKYGIDSIKVVTEDGTRYDAKMYRANPAKDLAVVEIQTGKDTDKICKPAQAVDQEVKLQPGDGVVTYGQPYATGTIYTSEGTARSQITRGRAVRELRADAMPPGDDKDRQMDVLTIRATPGYSGAPVYPLKSDATNQGKSPQAGDNSQSPGLKPRFMGLIDMADERVFGLITPVTQQDVKQLTD